MKKVIILFSLSLLPFALAYSQTEEDTTCRQNLEDIFKVQELYIKYEAVQSLYNEFLDVKGSIIRNKHVYRKWLNDYFLTIKGVPINFDESQLEAESNFEKFINGNTTEEEVNSYIKQLNCSPEKANKEYRDFIQKIKLEKEKYLKCIEAELAKGDESEYANEYIINYFRSPGSSLIPPGIKKIDYLKVFKEFIFNDNQEALPDVLRVKAYLKCGCKI